ncbi:MAG: response regulator [bacterium]|nr:response regulator [bacterium]
MDTSPRQYRTLIITNDHEFESRLSELLEDQGYLLVTVDSIVKGNALLQRDCKFDVIVCDLELTDGSGLKLLKSLKSERRLAKIPVIICSDSGDVEIVRQSIDLGATDFVIKPLDSDSFFSKVERAINKGPGELLVVDDEDLLLNLLKRLLEREGHKVVTVSSGEEALDLLEKKNISLVLADIKMSGISGVELLIHIKKKYPPLPVLLMTGYGGEYSKDEVISAGADGYILKPFNNLEIANRVTSVLSMSRNVSTAQLRKKTFATV